MTTQRSFILTLLPDGKVKIYIEKPDEKVCFKHAACYLLDYKWDDIYEFTQDEINEYHLLL